MRRNSPVAFFADAVQRMQQPVGMMLALGIARNLRADHAGRVVVVLGAVHAADRALVDDFDIKRAGRRAIVRTGGKADPPCRLRRAGRPDSCRRQFSAQAAVRLDQSFRSAPPKPIFAARRDPDQQRDPGEELSLVASRRCTAPTRTIAELRASSRPRHRSRPIHAGPANVVGPNVVDSAGSVAMMSPATQPSSAPPAQTKMRKRSQQRHQHRTAGDDQRHAGGKAENDQRRLDRRRRSRCRRAPPPSRRRPRSR